MFLANPQRIHANLETLSGRFADGELRPLPLTAYALTEAVDAFRYMAQAHHIGKVVLTSAAPNQSAIRSDATYLVTGGLGALGLGVAGWLVRQGARHVALAGRHAPSESQQRQIDELCRGGARVTAFASDIADPGDAARLLSTIRSAAVLDDGVALQQTPERFATVLGPKAGGAWNLHLLTKDWPLDFFVMFSSLASLLGSPGQSNYSAANAFLDALARQRRAEGLAATSISWGPWADAGMAATSGARNQTRWLDQGITAINTSDALIALEMAIDSTLPHVGVVNVDWERYLSQPFARGLAALTSELPTHVKPQAAAPTAITRGPSLAERLRRAPQAQRKSTLLQHLRDRTVKVLGLAPGFRLDAHQGLRDVGLDSLLAIELRNALQADVESQLPATLAFDHPTLDALTTFLASAPLAPLFAQASTAPAPAAAGVDDLSQLTDAEAEAMLLAELSGQRSEGN
jgi:NAD(P)-dependent dehydrogenase (short-subunit alcohol dehydrogenase family)